jgi:hypothetical protein
MIHCANGSELVKVLDILLCCFWLGIYLFFTLSLGICFLLSGHIFLI